MENKARPEERGRKAAQDAAPAPGEDAAKRKKRRRGRSGGGQEMPPEEPAASLLEEPLVLRGQPVSRGVRQGRIHDTLPQEPSVPVTDFYKPNPLDSDVIMDATARLLAPRKPSAASPQAQLPQREPQDRKNSKKSQSQKKRDQEKPAQPKPRHEERRGKRKKQGAPPQPAREPVLPPSLSGGQRRRRDSRPRPIEAPPRSDRQKDSTQHKSLMRPYYLHDDE